MPHDKDDKHTKKAIDAAWDLAAAAMAGGAFNSMTPEALATYCVETVKTIRDAEYS